GRLGGEPLATPGVLGEEVAQVAVLDVVVVCLQRSEGAPRAEGTASHWSWTLSQREPTRRPLSRPSRPSAVPRAGRRRSRGAWAPGPVRPGECARARSPRKTPAGREAMTGWRRSRRSWAGSAASAFG